MTHIPTIDLLIIIALFDIARFENQRWYKARQKGFRGANQYYGIFIDSTCLLSFYFYIIFLAAYFYDEGWIRAILLFGITQLIGMFYTSLSTKLYKQLKNVTKEPCLFYQNDSIIAWFIGTFAVWPLAITLVMYVSWFGVF